MMPILLIEQYALEQRVVLGVCFTFLGLLIIYYGLKTLEMAYVLKNKKPYFVHFYLRLKTLSHKEKSILSQNFSFYNTLSKKHKKYFEHRVALFIKDKDFVGAKNYMVTDKMRVLISATAVMLTFGFRDFYISLLSKIVIYPKAFYSKMNKAYHKGEFNPKLKALVLSWEDFEEGFKIENDNLNLGIHELTHAIHLNSIKERDISSTIFKDSFSELASLLSSKKELREKLILSQYFRGYAYTNKFEFLAVIIENFIETPDEFKSEFPRIYNKVKQMLNFNMNGY